MGWNLGDDPGDDPELERIRAHVWSVATTCGALATSEPGAFATHGRWDAASRAESLDDARRGNR